MAKLNLHRERRTLRTAVSVVGALFVLGFASLVFLHDASSPSMAASALPAAVGNLPAAGEAETSATSRFPAESVFRGALYTAPDEAIAQF